MSLATDARLPVSVPDAAPQRGARVLLVDDDALVLGSTAAMLEEAFRALAKDHDAVVACIAVDREFGRPTVDRGRPHAGS